MMGLVSVQFSFFGSVILYFLTKLVRLRFFGFRLMKSKLNRTKYFFKYSNWFIRFFSWFDFFSYFFRFSWFNLFFGFSCKLLWIVAGSRRNIIWRQRRLWSCFLIRCCVGNVFRFNHKIVINVQESPPSIMVIRNLWSTRVWVRDWLCKGKTYHPQCTLPKVSCIVVWLFFLSRVSICWSFLRFKVDLYSWKSLYIIELNPNHSEVWILASHLFTPCIFNTWEYTLSYNFTPYRY